MKRGSYIRRLQNVSTLQVQHVYDSIVNIIAEILWCKSEVFSAKEIELFMKRNDETLMKKAEKKFVLKNHLDFKTLFIDIITFNLKHLSKDISRKISQIRNVGGCFI